MTLRRFLPVAPLAAVALLAAPGVAHGWHATSVCANGIWTLGHGESEPMSLDWHADGTVDTTVPVGAHAATVPDGVNKVKATWPSDRGVPPYHRPHGCKPATTTTTQPESSTTSAPTTSPSTTTTPAPSTSAVESTSSSSAPPTSTTPGTVSSTTPTSSPPGTESTVTVTVVDTTATTIVEGSCADCETSTSTPSLAAPPTTPTLPTTPPPTPSSPLSTVCVVRDGVTMSVPVDARLATDGRCLLPSTGSVTGGVVPVALVVLAAGAVALVSARRRRPA